MKIYPAIDIKNGSAVRLTKGEFDKVTEYSTNPAEVAVGFEKIGAKYLHVVDLDGAVSGANVNFEKIKDVVKSTNLFVEVGGGIRANETIKRYLDVGVSRVIIGTLAIKDPQFLLDAVKLFGDKIAVGVDCLNGYIAIDGWKTVTNKKGEDYVKYLCDIGVKTTICTDISKDGVMQGTNLGFYKTLSKYDKIDVIASGGITYLSEIEALTDMKIYGAILGKSMYEGKISLKMLTKRIIPCLDIKNGRVVKGTNFERLNDVENPVVLAEFYNESGADELVFYDITASYEGRKLFVDTLKGVASKVFIPLTVGGGINSVDDFSLVLDAGADKVSVNSGAIKNKNLIGEAAKKFGAQCVVLSMDVKKLDGKYVVFSHGGRVNTGIDAIEWVKFGQNEGAGEIVVNSIDTDGVKNGFDIDMLKAVCEVTSLPVIASGGAGNIEHFIDLFNEVPTVDAGLAASIFHFKQVEIAKLKAELKQKGINVRI